MTKDHDPYLGGTAIYTEDEAGNRTLVSFKREHEPPAAPADAAKADAGQAPVPASLPAVLLPAPSPETADKPAPETADKTALAQKAKPK